MIVDAYLAADQRKPHRVLDALVVVLAALEVCGNPLPEKAFRIMLCTESPQQTLQPLYGGLLSQFPRHCRSRLCLLALTFWVGLLLRSSLSGS